MNEKKKEVNFQEIIELLDSGKTRPEINELLGLNKNEAKLVWSQPGLKNRKPLKQTINVDLIGFPKEGEPKENLEPPSIPTNIGRSLEPSNPEYI